ncbi:MAG: hypothetical protein P0Y63_09560 [Klebsiella huaxiensis]|uniref:hypothetical protein n=1 Tax=Klebsiella huaxiensis TaxID=2153354 RepID=UPI0026F36F8F|nr:hypothetical protein [Klebsiella huaxiensis]WEJ91248.1 MAG: hypothetical protein P0Y63_09560 [Klebsiella huaxiensis]
MTRPTTAQLNAAYDQFNFWYDKAKKLDEELAKAEERIDELESRTVTVKLPDFRATYIRSFADEVEHQVRNALDAFSTAAGIKWEAE